MNKEFIKNILTEELFGTTICENVEDLNIVNYFYDNLLLEKILYGEPISVPELRKLLRKKIVNFEFIKLDGSDRKAIGTTRMDYIPIKDHPKGIRPSSPKVATFYDLDKDAWRSVSQRSKEIVLKKDEKTNKPIIVVKDKDKARVDIKPIPKERKSKSPIEQGQTYKYTTNAGKNTYVKIERQMANGKYQVTSPLFKTTFVVEPNKIGDKYTPKTKEEKPTVTAVEKPVDASTHIVEPKTEVPVEKPKEQPKQPETKPIQKPVVKPVVKPAVKKTEKKPDVTVLLPVEKKSEEDTSKAPPIDLNKPEAPEELTK